MNPVALYDRIGTTYAAARTTDPAIARAVEASLGGARTVLNVGAGTGSYEPADRAVVAVEPSPVMIAQRPDGAAPAVRGLAERLPFVTGTFDAATALLSLHHWTDPLAGVAELSRVARRVSILTVDPRVASAFWLVREYVPSIGRWDLEHFPPIAKLADAVAGTVETVPVPATCEDGFLAASWKRPARYLDPGVRAAISAFSLVDAAEVEHGLGRLRRDLAEGAWHARHADLRDVSELDCGYRLIVGTGTAD